MFPNLTKRKKWGISAIVSGVASIVVGVFAVAGAEAVIALQVLGLLGMVLEALGFFLVFPGDPPT